jgi:hypothetical protein
VLGACARAPLLLGSAAVGVHSCGGHQPPQPQRRRARPCTHQHILWQRLVRQHALPQRAVREGGLPLVPLPATRGTNRDRRACLERGLLNHCAQPLRAVGERRQG